MIKRGDLVRLVNTENIHVTYNDLIKGLTHINIDETQHHRDKVGKLFKIINIFPHSHIYGITLFKLACITDENDNFIVSGDGIQTYTEAERLKDEESKNKRAITFNFKFGNLSESGYRHFPILYFAYGSNGFQITIFGLSTLIKYK